MLRAAKPGTGNVKMLEELEDVMKEAKSILMADFRGMSVDQINDLRRECFKNDVKFRVAKNRIAKIAFQNIGFPAMGEILTGPTGFCFGYDDPITPVRIFAEFARAHERPDIKACLIDGKLYGAEKIDELKDIPPRDVLLAAVVGAIASPLSGFVQVLNEILRSFVGVIEAVSKHYEETGNAPEGLAATGGSVENVIEAIEKMTVLELVELKKSLEDKFGVSATAPMAMAAGPVVAVEEEEEQTEFTVILTSSGDKKIQVIKEVRSITGLGLKEAKALVDESPKPIKEDISKEEADAIRTKIEDAGGQVDVK